MVVEGVATGGEGAEGCEGTVLSPTHGNRKTAVVGGSGRTCDSEERGQAEERGGLLVGRGTLGDAFLYERQAVRAQANWETRRAGSDMLRCSSSNCAYCLTTAHGVVNIIII